MSKNLIDISRRQADQLVQQAEMSRGLLDKILEHERKMEENKREMTEMKNEIIDVKDNSENLYLEIKGKFEAFENTVPLTGPQADRLHSFCSRKGHQFTREYFDQQVSQELYSKKYGHLIRGIFTVIKKRYEVSKYNQVRRVDGEEAIAFVESLTLNDLPKNYLRLTDTQKDTAARHGDYRILERLG